MKKWEGEKKARIRPCGGRLNRPSGRGKQTATQCFSPEVSHFLPKRLPEAHTFKHLSKSRYSQVTNLSVYSQLTLVLDQ